MIKGVIMEVNPFHNGHKYFLEQIEKSDSDLLIAITSTNLCQRGELSVLTKDTKTKLLLEHNVDIVIELPGVLANQGGTYFAYHAINILNELKIEQLICGSETGLLPVIKENNLDFKSGIYKEQLANLQSNDILALSYLKAINTINPNIKLKLIKRIANNYNDTTISGKITSATSIRNNIDNLTLIKNTLPSLSYSNLLRCKNTYLFEIFKLNLTTCLLDNIEIFLSHNNQLLVHLQKVLTQYPNTSMEEFIELASNKNNPKNKIRRIMMNIILIVKDDNYNSLEYIKVLGFSPQASSYLKILNHPKIIMSLKHQDSNVAKVEKKISFLHQQIYNYQKNLDYLGPIKGEL